MLKDFNSEGDGSVCNNCGHQPLSDYCPNCGQRAAQRLSTADVFRDSLDKLVELDFGLLRTLKGMLLDPGRVAREYLAGRRRHYVNPLIVLPLFYLSRLLSLPA